MAYLGTLIIGAEKRRALPAEPRPVPRPFRPVGTRGGRRDVCRLGVDGASAASAGDAAGGFGTGILCSERAAARRHSCSSLSLIASVSCVMVCRSDSSRLRACTSSSSFSYSAVSMKAAVGADAVGPPSALSESRRISAARTAAETGCMPMAPSMWPSHVRRSSLLGAAKTSACSSSRKILNTNWYPFCGSASSIRSACSSSV